MGLKSCKYLMGKKKYNFVEIVADNNSLFFYFFVIFNVIYRGHYIFEFILDTPVNHYFGGLRKNEGM